MTCFALFVSACGAAPDPQVWDELERKLQLESIAEPSTEHYCSEDTCWLGSDRYVQSTAVRFLDGTSASVEALESIALEPSERVDCIGHNSDCDGVATIYAKTEYGLLALTMRDDESGILAVDGP